MKMLDALAQFNPVQEKLGDVGIEVEMEGDGLPTRGIRGWTTKPEGSLRGEAAEYVLSEPCIEEEVDPLLTRLWDTFRLKRAVLHPSNRCSVHVHINVQRMTEVQVFNFITLYLIAEDALVNWCGEGRVGNLFCLRARDAEFVIDSLEETSVDGLWHRLHTNDLRYAALNCKALGDFGSLEFRSLRGTDDPGIIKTWVSILLRLREAALRYDFPNNILDGFSAGGEEAFCREVFGKHFEELFNYEGWRGDVRSGMRRCQCIAYSGDWLALTNNEVNLYKKAGEIPRAKKMVKHIGGLDMRDWAPAPAGANPVEWVAIDERITGIEALAQRAFLEANRQRLAEQERKVMERFRRNLRNEEVIPDDDEE